MRIGDVLAATDTAAAASLQFYVWQTNGSAGRYVTNPLFMPMNAGFNDKKSELGYKVNGDQMAYSVWNPLGKDVTLNIPATPVALSSIAKVAAKKNAAGWSLAVRSSTMSDGDLSPVFCAYVAGGSGSLEYPLPPSWGNVRVGIYDAGRKAVFGNVIARELVNGGYAYELVFENDQSSATAISYHIDSLAGSGNARITLIDPESGSVISKAAGADFSITVDAHSREYRWLAVGSQTFVDGFGGSLVRGEFALVRIMPNPLRGIMRIEYRIPYGGIESVRCEMIDQLGRIVWSTKADNNSVHPGRNLFIWDPRGRRIASGTYVIRLTGFDGRGKVAGQKLAKVMYLP